MRGVHRQRLENAGAVRDDEQRAVHALAVELHALGDRAHRIDVQTGVGLVEDGPDDGLELVAEEEELIAQCEEENGVQFYRFTDEDVETWRAVITDLIEEYKGVYGEAACTAFGVQ